MNLTAKTKLFKFWVKMGLHKKLVQLVAANATHRQSGADKSRCSLRLIVSVTDSEVFMIRVIATSLPKGFLIPVLVPNMCLVNCFSISFFCFVVIRESGTNKRDGHIDKKGGHVGICLLQDGWLFFLNDRYSGARFVWRMLVCLACLASLSWNISYVVNSLNLLLLWVKPIRQLLQCSACSQ